MNSHQKCDVIIAIKNVQLANFSHELFVKNQLSTLNMSDELHNLQPLVEQAHPEYLLISSCFKTSLDGLAICQQIKADPRNNTKCIVLFARNIKGILAKSEADISAYLYDDATFGEIEHAIEQLKLGKKYITPAILNDHSHLSQIDDKLLAKLTLREREIFELVGLGWHVPQIADKLCISHKTVETHKTHIADKLELGSVARLQFFAIRAFASYPISKFTDTPSKNQ